MPCSDSSSSMVIWLDKDELFKSFEYGKITCGQEIKAGTVSLNSFFSGKGLDEIINSKFATVTQSLGVFDEEGQFILYMQWDALRCAAGLYLGIASDEIDTDRCAISSVGHHDSETEISLVIMPPQEMPKILPCHFNRHNLN